MNGATVEKQRKLSEFVGREVILCQSHLVDALLANQEVPEVDWENIENIYSPLLPYNDQKDTCVECEAEVVDLTSDELCEDCNTPQEIFEWWVCSSWLIEKLRAMGEPVLDTDYGTWWGRTTTGQAISLDYAIEKIYDELHK